MGVFFYQPNWYKYTEKVILQDLKGKGDSFKTLHVFKTASLKASRGKPSCPKDATPGNPHFEENTNQIQVPLNKINENEDFGTWKKTPISEKEKNIYKPRHTTNFLVSAVSFWGCSLPQTSW